MTPHARDKEKSHHKTKPQSTPSNPPLVNGLPPHPLPLPLHPLVPPQPYTIEIDPSLKYTPQSSGLSNESVGNFCLPSPRQSILGPIRTLHIFNESNSTNHRPVRQVKKVHHDWWLLHVSYIILDVDILGSDAKIAKRSGEQLSRRHDDKFCP